MDESYIEENFVFCTYCEDHKYVNSIYPGGHPCPRCNLEEYLEWKKWKGIGKKEENEGE